MKPSFPRPSAMLGGGADTVGDGVQKRAQTKLPNFGLSREYFLDTVIV